MKITIDTKEDSHEDIRKVLHLLTNLVSSETTFKTENIEEEKKVDTTSMMNMFGSSSTPEKKDTGPDFSSFLNLSKEEEKEDSKIEFF